MKQLLKQFETFLILWLLPLAAFAQQHQTVRATDYGQWSARLTASVAASASSVTVAPCLFQPAGGADSHSFEPYATNVPVFVSDAASSETLTVTAVGAQTQDAKVAGGCKVTLTAHTTYAHAANTRVGTGDGGLMEAANRNPAKVLLDGNFASTTALTALTPPTPAPVLEDLTGSYPVTWTVRPSTLTAISAPATRSASAGATQVVDGTAAGTFANSTTYVCVTYVDRLGGESPCSASYSFTPAGSKSLSYAAPAASTGAVGWRAYAGLSLAAQYQLPISATTCKLSTVTPYPTCAIGAAAVFTTPLTTSGLAPALGGFPATYRPNTQSHTTFAYAPSPLPTSFQRNYGPFAISSALTAGQAVVLGTVPLPAAYLNYIGKTIRISGRLTVTASTGGTDQILVGLGNSTDFSTGTPKALCTLTETTAITTAAQDQYFSCILTVNATGTTGSIMPSGFSILQLGAGTTAGAAAVESATAAITADVASQSTLNVEFLQTSAAESTTPPQLQDLHIEEL